jgi:ubiquitin-like modifier-activating enzyme ATG7
MISFMAPKSSVETGFWEELYSRKLNLYRLESRELEILGSYTPSDGQNASALVINSSSFDTLAKCISRYGDEGLARGILLNVNTAQEFKDFDKKGWIESAGRNILEVIRSGKWLSDPSLLFAFRVLSFADLKQHTFTYWFAFPALVADETSFTYTCQPRILADVLDAKVICNMYNGLAMHVISPAGLVPVLPVCGLVRVAETTRVLPLEDAWNAFLRGEEVFVIILDSELSGEIAGNYNPML